MSLTSPQILQVPKVRYIFHLPSSPLSIAPSNPHTRPPEVFARIHFATFPIPIFTSKRIASILNVFTNSSLSVVILLPYIHSQSISVYFSRTSTDTITSGFLLHLVKGQPRQCSMSLPNPPSELCTSPPGSSLESSAPALQDRHRSRDVNSNYHSNCAH